MHPCAQFQTIEWGAASKELSYHYCERNNVLIAACD